MLHKYYMKNNTEKRRN